MFVFSTQRLLLLLVCLKNAIPVATTNTLLKEPGKSRTETVVWKRPMGKSRTGNGRVETAHGTQTSAMNTFDEGVLPGLARYCYNAFPIHVRHTCLHLFRPLLQV